MAVENFKRTKRACYFSYSTMVSVFCLPPLLFATFREMYGISYTLLGTLVLTNFCTQLTVDLIFTFFSKYFNIKKTVCAMPLLTALGLGLYALAPVLFPGQVYAGLLMGTVIFSVSAGLSEVLLSPIIAAIPSKTPDRDMSLLHSLYAFGFVAVTLFCSGFLRLFGTENWMYLTGFLALLPVITSVMFALAPMPNIQLSGDAKSGQPKTRHSGLWLCVLCIFLGSAAENTMSNWISAYMENALQIPKMWGDILGMTGFALLLGLGRILYAKYGKDITRVLTLSMLGAAVCYLIAGLSPNIVVATAACAMTGLFTSLLWPGALIFMEEKFPALGVAAYALMAAGGDFGASVAPQMMGFIVDTVAESSWAVWLGNALSLTPDQIGMKTGMLVAMLFPLLGTLLLLYMRKFFGKKAALQHT